MAIPTAGIGLNNLLTSSMIGLWILFTTDRHWSPLQSFPRLPYKLSGRARTSFKYVRHVWSNSVDNVSAAASTIPCFDTDSDSLESGIIYSAFLTVPSAIVMHTLPGLHTLMTRNSSIVFRVRESGNDWLKLWVRSFRTTHTGKGDTAGWDHSHSKFFIFI